MALALHILVGALLIIPTTWIWALNARWSLGDVMQLCCLWVAGITIIFMGLRHSF